MPTPLEPPAARPLAGRAALVTGASRRVGLAIAARLAEAGAAVALHAHRDLDGARRAALGIVARGGRAVALGADLTDADACTRLVAEAEAALGALDVLVHGAARFERTPWERLTAEDFDRAMALNARPAVTLGVEAGRRMRARGQGVIVNIACTSGQRPWKNHLAYSASKAALLSLTQGLALALAPEVRVNAVAPGPVLPPDGLTAAEAARIAATTLLGRWGTPEDVAEAVLFLAVSPWLTGVILPVDGGRTAR